MGGYGNQIIIIILMMPYIFFAVVFCLSRFIFVCHVCVTVSSTVTIIIKNSYDFYQVSSYYLKFDLMYVLLWFSLNFQLILI